MNKHLTEVMQKSWRDWHGATPEDEIPSVNLSYEKGFNAASVVLEHALNILQNEYEKESYIAYQEDVWCLFMKDGNGITAGKTFVELLLNIKERYDEAKKR